MRSRGGGGVARLLRCPAKYREELRWPPPPTATSSCPAYCIWPLLRRQMPKLNNWAGRRSLRDLRSSALAHTACLGPHAGKTPYSWARRRKCPGPGGRGLQPWRSPWLPSPRTLWSTWLPSLRCRRLWIVTLLAGTKQVSEEWCSSLLGPIGNMMTDHKPRALSPKQKELDLCSPLSQGNGICRDVEKQQGAFWGGWMQCEFRRMGYLGEEDSLRWDLRGR